MNRHNNNIDMHLAKHGLEFVIDPHGRSQLTRRAGTTSGDLVRHLDNGYEFTLCCSIIFEALGPGPSSRHLQSKAAVK